MKNTIATRLMGDVVHITRGVDRIKIIAPLAVKIDEDWKGGQTFYIYKDDSFICWTWDKMTAVDHWDRRKSN